MNSSSEYFVNNYGWNDKSRCRPNRSYTIPVIMRHIRRYRPARILDLGCGDGVITAAIAGAGFNIVGMEPDAEGCRKANERYPGIPFHCLGCYDNPARLPERGFDFVLSSEVIEHLYFPGRLLDFAASVLVPDGKLMVLCPYHGYLKNLVISLVDGWDQQHTSLKDGMHIKFWSFKTLNTLLERHGFEVLYNGGCGRLPYLWKCAVVIGRKR